MSPAQTPEKYTLATAPPVDRKEIGTLGAVQSRASHAGFKCHSFGRQREDIEKDRGAPAIRLDPFEFFFRNPRQFRNPNEEAMVQNSLGSGVIVTNEGHIITNNHVVDQVDEIEVQLSDGRDQKGATRSGAIPRSIWRF